MENTMKQQCISTKSSIQTDLSSKTKYFSKQTLQLKATVLEPALGSEVLTVN